MNLSFSVTLIFLVFIVQLKAQAPDWSAFENLLDKTWIAEGKWGDNSAFKQRISFTTDLKGHIIHTEAEGFTNQEKTEFGKRNHGIRRWNAERKQYEFYEFDAFGGLTTGEVIFEGKDICYRYDYGGTVLQDKWKYLNDSTYQFTVSSKDAEGKETIYLNTEFTEEKKEGIINTLAGYLLEQNWNSYAWAGVLEESWVLEEDRLKQTAVYTENEKVIYEAVSFIEHKGGELILTSVIKGNNPKVFKAVRISPTEVVFKNTDYKNPWEVTYSFTDGTYKRTIKGVEHGKATSFTFEFEAK